MEGLKYLPQTLRSKLMLDESRGKRSTRDGVLLVFDNDGNYRSFLSDFVDVLHQIAKKHLTENHSDQLILWENSCGLSGTPFPDGEIPEQVLAMVKRGGEIK